MKTEAEIRKHLDDLRRFLCTPCTCAGAEEIICVAQRQRVLQMAAMLAWVVGELPNYDRSVEVFSQEMSQ